MGARSSFIADVVVVVAFVAVGRETHDEGNALADLLRTATPFLAGVGASWLALRAWRQPRRFRTGFQVTAGTVLVGMLVRRLGFDDGTATSFVVVATGFLLLGFVGWRLVAGLARRRPPVTSETGRSPVN
jgi:hypothetical protein